MKKTQYGNICYESNQETEARSKLSRMLKNTPIPDDEILQNLGLFLNSKNLSKILFLDYLYKKVVDVFGCVVDFGTRYGNNAAIFSGLRGIYEPFNRHRKILAFDTFEGFQHITEKDGKSELMKNGNDRVGKNYDKYLEKILFLQEKDNPISHIKKHSVFKGNAPEMLSAYLKKYPQTIMAMVYFDFDIYEPTKKCIELILPHLVKGSIIVFDELGDDDSPGETIALQESIGLNNVKLERYRYVSRASYCIF
jgi:hypothetical protein